MLLADESFILEALRVEGRVYRARFVGSLQDYFVELENGRCLFVKRVPASLSSVLEASEKIATWLHAHRCCVLLLMDRLPLGEGDRADILWVYWYTPGRPCEATISDMVLLGQSVGQLHTQLRRNADVLSWRKNTMERYTAYDSMRTRVLNEGFLAMQSRYLISRAAYDVIHDFFSAHDFSYFFETKGQPLHGSLAISNFFITLDKNVCFFNFSETPYSFEPPLIELSYMIEQLLMSESEIEGRTEKEIISLGILFMENYVRSGGSYSLAFPYSMGFLLLKSLCRLLFDEQKNNLFYPQEWDRLVSLIDQVPYKNHLLRNIIAL